MLNGGVSVFCFFVISGFYIEMILSEKYSQEKIGSGYIRAFYLARFWRLYPIYITVAVAVIVASQFTPLLKIPGGLNFSAWGILVGVLNFSMMLLNVPSVNDLVIGPSWSIGVEVGFYAVAPFLLNKRLGLLLWLAALTIILQFIPYGSHAPLLFAFPFFLAGALARRYRRFIVHKLRLFMALPIWTLYGLAILMFVFPIPHAIYLGAADVHALNTLDLFFYPALTAVIVPILHERTKTNKADYLIGQLSYPFYIVHQPVIDLLGQFHNDFRIPTILILVTTLAATFTWLELTLIEPWRKRFAKVRAT